MYNLGLSNGTRADLIWQVCPFKIKNIGRFFISVPGTDIAKCYDAHRHHHRERVRHNLPKRFI
jgi:hypothetical protein